MLSVGAKDLTAQSLIVIADRLLDALRDVLADAPRPGELQRISRGDRLLDVAFRDGLEALGWVADERGLGGGREMDGLAWSLPLEVLWESYVESIIRQEAALTGGRVRSGRKRETVFPLDWSDPSHRSLGHLIPDIVVMHERSVHVVDAKYKAHLAELDEQGWERFTDDKREAHRADLHQALAHASLFSADEVRATLVYPLRRGTFEALQARGRDRSVAELLQGSRRVRLELRGLPFGGPHERR